MGTPSSNTGWSTDPTSALRVKHGVQLSQFDTRATPGFDGKKADAAALLAGHGERLAGLQERLFAGGRSGDTRSVLLVLQGMDTSGKGGIVRHVLGMVDPQGIAHASFGKPTTEELAHDFLWRIAKQVPTPGQIGVFDRSHYEDVLVVRVHNLVPAEQWESRYQQIVEWENSLIAAGTTVIKCALVISKDEQKQRLAERLDRPDKYWKFKPGDIDERGYWDDYQQAYDAVFARTDTDGAPWYAIPADRKWFARLAVTELLIDALEKLELQWPPADFDVDVERARLAAS